MRKLIAILLAIPAAANGGRPMITDDARMLDPKACQVESWVQRNRDSTDFWLMPACNPAGNMEIGIGGARVQRDGENVFAQQVLQAKTVLRPLEPNGWAVGLTAGTVRHLRREAGNGWPGDSYFNVPVSVSFADDAWVVHVNAGAVHRRDEGRNLATWGLGNEIRLADNLHFLPEMFRNERGRPFYQASLRYMAREWLQLDATFGDRVRPERPEHWFSLGFRVQTPPLFP